jgi:hypothetical protein
MTLAIDSQFRTRKQSFIARHERFFLWLLMIVTICLALIMGLTAPLWAEDELQTYTLAILHAGNKAEIRWLRTEGECEDLIAQQESTGITVEGTPVTQVECQCVTFTADGQEVTQ